jgi:hypothetical protein
MSEKITELRHASAEALHLMEVMGWNEATTGENTTQDDMALAVAAERAYARLKKALGVPAAFAAAFVLDPIGEARKEIEAVKVEPAPTGPEQE